MLIFIPQALINWSMAMENSCFNTIGDICWVIIHVYNSKELNWAGPKLKWLENVCVISMFGYMCFIWDTKRHTWVGWIWVWIDSSCHRIKYNQL